MNWEKVLEKLKENFSLFEKQAEEFDKMKYSELATTSRAAARMCWSIYTALEAGLKE